MGVSNIRRGGGWLKIRGRGLLISASALGVWSLGFRAGGLELEEP